MPLSRMICETKAIPRMIALNHRHITELRLLIFMALILAVAFITFALESNWVFMSHMYEKILIVLFYGVIRRFLKWVFP
jgi:hypothetical protein